MNAQDGRPVVDLEQIPHGEDEAIQKIIDLEREILEKMIGENLPVPRAQHPKHHGCVRANFIVAKNVPEKFRVGIFTIPGNTFPAWIRFSNARKQDDRKTGGHGMAIKLMQVPGEKLLPGQEHGQTQDFLLLDSPTFFIKNAIEFAEFDAAQLKSPSSRSPKLQLMSLIVGYFLKHPLEFLGLATFRRKTDAARADGC
jgi:catalase